MLQGQNYNIYMLLISPIPKLWSLPLQFMIYQFRVTCYFETIAPNDNIMTWGSYTERVRFSIIKWYSCPVCHNVIFIQISNFQEVTFVSSVTNFGCKGIITVVLSFGKVSLYGHMLTIWNFQGFLLNSKFQI